MALQQSLIAIAVGDLLENNVTGETLLIATEEDEETFVKKMLAESLTRKRHNCSKYLNPAAGLGKWRVVSKQTNQGRNNKRNDFIAKSTDVSEASLKHCSECLDKKIEKNEDNWHKKEKEPKIANMTNEISKKKKEYKKEKRDKCLQRFIQGGRHGPKKCMLASQDEECFNLSPANYKEKFRTIEQCLSDISMIEEFVASKFKSLLVTGRYLDVAVCVAHVIFKFLSYLKACINSHNKEGFKARHIVDWILLPLAGMFREANSFLKTTEDWVNAQKDFFAVIADTLKLIHDLVLLKLFSVSYVPHAKLELLLYARVCPVSDLPYFCTKDDSLLKLFVDLQLKKYHVEPVGMFRSSEDKERFLQLMESHIPWKGMNFLHPERYTGNKNPDLIKNNIEQAIDLVKKMEDESGRSVVKENRIITENKHITRNVAYNKEKSTNSKLVAENVNYNNEIPVNNEQMTDDVSCNIELEDDVCSVNAEKKSLTICVKEPRQHSNNKRRDSRSLIKTYTLMSRKMIHKNRPMGKLWKKSRQILKKNILNAKAFHLNRKRTTLQKLDKLHGVLNMAETDKSNNSGTDKFTTCDQKSGTGKETWPNFKKHQETKKATSCSDDTDKIEIKMDGNSELKEKSVLGKSLKRKKIAKRDACCVKRKKAPTSSEIEMHQAESSTSVLHNTTELIPTTSHISKPCELKSPQMLIRSVETERLSKTDHTYIPVSLKSSVANQALLKTSSLSSVLSHSVRPQLPVIQRHLKDYQVKSSPSVIKREVIKTSQNTNKQPKLNYVFVASNEKPLMVKKVSTIEQSAVKSSWVPITFSPQTTTQQHTLTNTPFIGTRQLQSKTALNTFQHPTVSMNTVTRQQLVLKTVQIQKTCQQTITSASMKTCTSSQPLKIVANVARPISSNISQTNASYLLPGSVKRHLSGETNTVKLIGVLIRPENSHIRNTKLVTNAEPLSSVLKTLANTAVKTNTCVSKGGAGTCIGSSVLTSLPQYTSTPMQFNSISSIPALVQCTRAMGVIKPMQFTKACKTASSMANINILRKQFTSSATTAGQPWHFSLNAEVTQGNNGQCLKTQSDSEISSNKSIENRSAKLSESKSKGLSNINDAVMNFEVNVENTANIIPTSLISSAGVLNQQSLHVRSDENDLLNCGAKCKPVKRLAKTVIANQIKQEPVDTVLNSVIEQNEPLDGPNSDEITECSSGEKILQDVITVPEMKNKQNSCKENMSEKFSTNVGVHVPVSLFPNFASNRSAMDTLESGKCGLNKGKMVLVPIKDGRGFQCRPIFVNPTKILKTPVTSTLISSTPRNSAWVSSKNYNTVYFDSGQHMDCDFQKNVSGKCVPESDQVQSLAVKNEVESAKSSPEQAVIKKTVVTRTSVRDHAFNDFFQMKSAEVCGSAEQNADAQLSHALTNKNICRDCGMEFQSHFHAFHKCTSFVEKDKTGKSTSLTCRMCGKTQSSKSRRQLNICKCPRLIKERILSQGVGLDHVCKQRGAFSCENCKDVFWYKSMLYYHYISSVECGKKAMDKYLEQANGHSHRSQQAHVFKRAILDQLKKKRQDLLRAKLKART